MKTILAFTDKITVCDCCNKQNLKGTYAVTDELGNEYYFGSTCVYKNLGYSKKDINNDLNKTKSKAQFEYSELKDLIREKKLHPIEENREYKKAYNEIKNKYFLKTL